MKVSDVSCTRVQRRERDLYIVMRIVQNIHPNHERKGSKTGGGQGALHVVVAGSHKGLNERRDKAVFSKRQRRLGVEHEVVHRLPKDSVDSSVEL